MSPSKGITWSPEDIFIRLPLAQPELDPPYLYQGQRLQLQELSVCLQTQPLCCLEIAEVRKQHGTAQSLPRRKCRDPRARPTDATGPSKLGHPSPGHCSEVSHRAGGQGTAATMPGSWGERKCQRQARNERACTQDREKLSTRVRKRREETRVTE